MNKILKDIAKLKVNKLLESGKTEFQLINYFFNLYDDYLNIINNAEKDLIECCLYELGYERCKSGGWVKLNEG